MRRERLASRWQGRALLVAMILVTGAVGFGVSDGDAHATTYHAMCFDLCAGLAIVSVPPTLTVFAQVDPFHGGPAYAVYAVSLHRLDPPPKFPALS